MAKILVIDDDSSIRETLDLYLTEEGYQVHTAPTGTDGLNKFTQIVPDVVILDIRLPDVNGFIILEDLREEDENVKVIMITAHHDMESTIRAMKEGAFDYIHKPVDVNELDIAIRKALHALEMEKKIKGFVESTREYKVGDIIGEGPRMREIFKTIGVVSQSRTTVLIQGESGTGKELIAKVIHNNTAPNEPYIAVNCSAIVETLLESELFGHEKGSFTGAITRKPGKFEIARNGTVFLDEISEMSLNLQAKLLRVLQEMEFERVGGKDRIKVNARIIAATNKDLRTMVKEGLFRDDLYYRLNIVTIWIPPLRERKEDLKPLINYLLAKINFDLHKRIHGVSDEVIEVFRNYGWPGNIRELENLLVRAAVIAKGQVLVKSDFPDLQYVAEPSRPSDQDMDAFRDEAGRVLTLDEVEELHIRRVLKDTKKNKGEICEMLGISRPTFERKLEKYHIQFERE
ncbi:MAG TPA: sigma-54 dependent transcriptional regulator [Deltaproteobacteria bacterium]|nr:sigma-54 dependent transcriptional regulator [Deltaproteobacteria bacterium]HPR55738.1 sigma-54 dependent transcriptional regulator [Deltaproteobacteria bacterium]